MSHLNYCTSIWSGSPNAGLLETMQKKALRLICQKNYASHADPLFVQTRTLKLEHIVELNYLKISNNIINSKESLPIINIFNFIQVTKKRTRNDNLKLMKIPTCRVALLQRFPQYKLPTTYNKALTKFPCKIDKKMSTLISSYRNWRITQYSEFKCSEKNCYSCQQL